MNKQDIAAVLETVENRKYFLRPQGWTVEHEEEMYVWDHTSFCSSGGVVLLFL